MKYCKYLVFFVPVFGKTVGIIGLNGPFVEIDDNGAKVAWVWHQVVFHVEFVKLGEKKYRQWIYNILIIVWIYLTSFSLDALVVLNVLVFASKRSSCHMLPGVAISILFQMTLAGKKAKKLYKIITFLLTKFQLTWCIFWIHCFSAFTSTFVCRFIRLKCSTMSPIGNDESISSQRVFIEIISVFRRTRRIQNVDVLLVCQSVSDADAVQGFTNRPRWRTIYRTLIERHRVIAQYRKFRALININNYR